jgi:CRP-like cAMP-binding protein
MAREVRLPAGTVLCQQHDPPGDLYVILEGQVGFERDGRPLGQLGAGESIGAVGLFDDEPRPVTATATSDVSALVIDRWAFEDVWTENPELVRSIVSRLAARLRDLAR